MAPPNPWVPYCGAGPLPGELLARWNLDPVLILGLGLAALILWRRGSGARNTHAWSALLVTLILFVSPLCALSSALFAVRTAHHLALVVVLAPLLARALPRQRAPNGTTLLLATLGSALVFWLWHAPSLYAWALSHDGAYWLMQISLVGTATWFWRSLRSAALLPSVAALLVAMVSMGLIAALLTFAPTAFYAPHALTTMPWGLSPLEDQQLAGLLMWVPGSLAYLAAALVLVARRLPADDRLRWAR